MSRPQTDRRSPSRIPLLRPLYSISELARATGISRKSLRRALDQRGVQLFVMGGRPWVPLSEILAKLKPLWDSVQASGSLQGESEEDDPGVSESSWDE